MSSSFPPREHNPHEWAAMHPDVSLEDDVSATEDTNTDVNGDGKVDGYEVFTKAELVAECEARGLPTTGNKPDLVARLQAADAVAPPAEAAE